MAAEWWRVILSLRSERVLRGTYAAWLCRPWRRCGAAPGKADSPAGCQVQLDNILLHGRGDRPVVKICDFGYSKDEVAGSICKTACGTPEYMAPEVHAAQLSLSAQIAVVFAGSRH